MPNCHLKRSAERPRRQTIHALRIHGTRDRYVARATKQQKAAEVSIEAMRAFAEMRRFLANNAALLDRMAAPIEGLRVEGEASSV